MIGASRFGGDVVPTVNSRSTITTKAPSYIIAPAWSFFAHTRGVAIKCNWAVMSMGLRI